MAKHAVRRRKRERVGAVTATVGLVALLGLAIAVFVAVRPLDSDLAQDAASLSKVGEVGEVSKAGEVAGVVATSEPDEPQQVVQAIMVSRGQPLGAGQGKKAGSSDASALRRKVRKIVEVPPTASFRVASFNVLGASHTSNGGRGGRYAAGATRMGWATQLLTSTGITVAGLQELQPPQFGVLRSRLPGWGVYPGAGISQGAMANSITWNGAVWESVELHTTPIPYFGGRIVPMPYVLLRHRESGAEVWFANFHNPADAHGNAQRWRNEAVQRELTLARQLSADGTPLIITGDMNDREPYFCPSTADGTLHSASGGSVGTPCVMTPRTRVDWVMGTSEVSFTNYFELDNATTNRISDHPLIVGDATVG